MLALACFTLLGLCFSPPIGAFLAWSRLPEAQALLEVRRGAAVLQQVANPGAPIQDTLHGVIQWRLLFPVLGHVLGLPTPVFFALSHLGILALLGFVVTLFRRRGLGFGESFAALLMLGAGSWFFTSMGWLGYFDAWLALGLLLVAFAQSTWPVWLACLWAPWVDERFVIAFPLALFCRHLLVGVFAGKEARKLDLRREICLPVGLVLTYAVLRLGVLPSFSGTHAKLGGYLSSQNNLKAPFSVMLWGVWEGLRAGWVLAGAAVWFLWRRSQNLGLFLALGALGLLGVGLFSAQDFSRSMTMLLPLAVLGVLVLIDAAPAWRGRLLSVGAVAALALPAHHVMSDRVNPIYYLYHELYVLSHPPKLLMSEIHELEGIHSMERGDMAAAEAQLSFAIRLAENPSSALKQRGLLRASAGRWPEAKQDFAAMIECDGQNPESWFFHAQAQLVTGDAAGARADMQQALAIAPQGWSKRPDVSRFLAKLNQVR